MQGGKKSLIINSMHRFQRANVVNKTTFMFYMAAL